MSTPPAEVRLTDETLTYMEKLMQKAVQDGLTKAMTEQNAEAFWTAGFKVLQEQAARHTGRFVLGGMVGLFRKLLVFAFLGSIVYMIGGWTLLAKFWQSLFGGN